MVRAYGLGIRARTGHGARRLVDVEGDGMAAPGAAASHAEQIFVQFDMDGDDMMTEDEFMGRAEAALQRADGDGEVTVWDFRAEGRPR